ATAKSPTRLRARRRAAAPWETAARICLRNFRARASCAARSLPVTARVFNASAVLVRPIIVPPRSLEIDVPPRSHEIDLAEAAQSETHAPALRGRARRRGCGEPASSKPRSNPHPHSSLLSKSPRNADRIRPVEHYRDPHASLRDLIGSTAAPGENSRRSGQFPPLRHGLPCNTPGMPAKAWKRSSVVEEKRLTDDRKGLIERYQIDAAEAQARAQRAAEEQALQAEEDAKRAAAEEEARRAADDAQRAAEE